MSFIEKLDSILLKHQTLAEKMASGNLNPEEFTLHSKEYSALEDVANAIKAYRVAIDDKLQAEELLHDADMQGLAEEELAAINKTLPQLEHRVKVLLLPKDEADERNVIIEFRGGAGGDEAGLFAGDLFRMYQRYSEIKGWKFETISYSETGVGGIKEASASIKGKNVFSRLKFESGVHRVQRIPETESGGRVHTSTATVAVLPEAQEVDVIIDDKDIRVDIFRASGPGGQSVNTTDSAVRITHLPTGLVVQQQDEKSQHKNKAKALKVLRSRIYDLERKKLDDARSENRKGQVGTGDRSERIRTYNFPQGRMTDHRINLTLYSLDKIMTGDIDEIIDSLIAESQAKALSAIEAE